MNCPICNSLDVEALEQNPSIYICLECAHGYNVHGEPELLHSESGNKHDPILIWIRMGSMAHHVDKDSRIYNVSAMPRKEFNKCARAVGYNMSSSGIDGLWTTVVAHDSIFWMEDFEEEIFSANPLNVVVTIPLLSQDYSIREFLAEWEHLVDTSHVHFFTIESLEKLFDDHGYVMTEALNLEATAYDPVRDHGPQPITCYFRRKANL